MVTCRIGYKGLAEIDKVANREGLNRSDLLRLLVQYSLREMPQGWRPTPRF